MKTKLTTIIITVLAFHFGFAAEEKHEHQHGDEHAEHDGLDEDHDAEKGPNGGQIVESKAGFSFEVTVDKDRKARIVFLDKDHKPVALEAQTVSGIAGERSAPVKLSFAKGKDTNANVLISDNPLPAGAHVALLLNIRTTPEAKSTTERFELHLH